MYAPMRIHECVIPSCRICRLLFVCINKSKSTVKPRFRSLTMQKYKLPQTKTPYAVGTRRGYGVG